MSTDSSNSSGGVGSTKQPPTNKKKQISPSLHWFLTFNNYDEEDILRLLNICSNSSIVKRFRIQEEIGEKSKIRHLQGYIHFYKKTRPKNMFDSKIHWEKCRNIQASINYCSKEKTRNGREWSKGIIIKIPIKILDDDKLYDWEKEIIEIIKTEPDDRTIYWYWEKDGNIGKSTFCKYLAVKHGALILSGKGSDMKYGIVKYMEKNINYPRLIILDIPRTVKDFISYTGIEEIKNACFFSGKYEASMVLGNCPHIICFSNHYPSVIKMSLDRWNITYIGNDEINTELD